jgi:hypothetical protein
MVMRARELVSILSDRFGIEPETGAVIDRSLAAGNLRLQGKGRRWPEMTRNEAITFLIACLAVERPTKAAEEVAPWASSRAKVCQEPLRLEETEEGRTQLAELKMWDDEPPHHEDRPEVKFWRLLDRHMASVRDGNGTIGLVDYLRVVCDLFEANCLKPEQVKLSLARSHGRATVTFTDTQGSVLLLDSFDLPSAGPRGSILAEAKINLTASVSGFALQEIILRTDSPSR